MLSAIKKFITGWLRSKKESSNHSGNQGGNPIEYQLFLAIMSKLEAREMNKVNKASKRAIIIMALREIKRRRNDRSSERQKQRRGKGT